MKYFESYSISYNCLLLYLFGWVVVVFAIPGPDFSFYWFSANFTFVSAYSVVGGGGGALGLGVGHIATGLSAGSVFVRNIVLLLHRCYHQPHHWGFYWVKTKFLLERLKI